MERLVVSNSGTSVVYYSSESFYSHSSGIGDTSFLLFPTNGVRFRGALVSSNYFVVSCGAPIIGFFFRDDFSADGFGVTKYFSDE